MEEEERERKGDGGRGGRGERIGGRGEREGGGEKREGSLANLAWRGGERRGPPERRAEVPDALRLLCGSSPRLLQARCGRA